ncbi:uncharacterized protein CCOS01_12169, partial [Colletotrichum costaricense]
VRILFVATHLVRVAGFKTLFAQSPGRTVRPFRSRAGGGECLLRLVLEILGFLRGALGEREGVVKGGVRMSGCGS